MGFSSQTWVKFRHKLGFELGSSLGYKLTLRLFGSFLLFHWQRSVFTLAHFSNYFFFTSIYVCYVTFTSLLRTGTLQQKYSSGRQYLIDILKNIKSDIDVSGGLNKMFMFCIWYFWPMHIGTWRTFKWSILKHYTNTSPLLLILKLSPMNSLVVVHPIFVILSDVINDLNGDDSYTEVQHGRICRRRSELNCTVLHIPTFFCIAVDSNITLLGRGS